MAGGGDGKAAESLAESNNHPGLSTSSLWIIDFLIKLVLVKVLVN